MTNVDTNGQVTVFSLVRDAVNGLGRLFKKQHDEVLTFMRQPSPMKIAFNVSSNAAGVIGGGLTNPSPVTLYQCPMSAEAWINRIGIQAQGSSPGAPLTTGQMLITGSSAGQMLLFLPIGGTVAPVLYAEGRISSIHLAPGEQILIVGDGLPVNTQFRFDFQIILVQGVSNYTPAIPDELEILP